MITKISVLTVTLLASFNLIAQAPAAPKAAQPAQKTIKRLKWVVAHNPTNEALNKMIIESGKTIEKRTKGAIVVEYEFYDNKIKARHGTALNAVISNTAQLAQVDIQVFNRLVPDLEVFNMPYLLQSHEQVKKVITGPFSEKIKASIAKAYPIVPIAFTYSGGYRMFYGSRPIRSLADFKNLRTTNQGSKGIVDYHQSLGLKVETGFTTREESVQKHKNKIIDVEDSELNRLYVLSHDYPELLNYIKYVTETQHMFYLTMIIANPNYINGFSYEEKQIVYDELQKLAETERVYSIKQEGDAKTFLKSKGIEFITMAPPQREAFINESKKLWKSYEATLGPLMKEIQTIK